MAILDKNLTVHEALEFLALNGVEWSETRLRVNMFRGAIKSFKLYNSRVIPREEMERVIREKKRGR